MAGLLLDSAPFGGSSGSKYDRDQDEGGDPANEMRRLQSGAVYLSQGCVKLGKRVPFCLPTAGRRTQFIDIIFTQPGKVLLVQPCTVF